MEQGVHISRRRETKHSEDDENRRWNRSVPAAVSEHTERLQPQSPHSCTSDVLRTEDTRDLQEAQEGREISVISIVVIQ